LIKFVIAFGQKIAALRPAFGGTKDWLVWKLLENSFTEARGPAQQQAVYGVNSAPSEAGNQNFTNWL